MIRDIIDYLVSYLRRNIYTLLDKRCRHVYFSKYGVIVPDFGRFVDNTDLLIKYPISTNGMFDCEYYEFISLFSKYNESQREKMLENLKPAGITLESNISETLELLETPDFRQNITKFKIIMYPRNFRSLMPVTITNSDLKKFYQILDFEGIDDILTIAFGDITDIEKLIHAFVDSKCGKRWVGFLPTHPIITELRNLSFLDRGRTYPELKTIFGKSMDTNIDIIAPKLEKICCSDFLDTYKMVTKYPTIKKIARVLDVTIEDCRSWLFREAYITLRRYDFDLHFHNGVILPRKNFDILMDIELEIYNKGESRIYRGIEALIDFVPTKEHWMLFDLDKVIQIL